MRFGKPRKNQRRVDPRYFLNETAKIENNSSKNMHDVQFYLEEFYPFAKEALGFDQDASIVFESDFSNAKNPLGKTAHYDPSNSTVTVYVDKRHPKDVMRSVSHELVHHAQNVRGDLQGASMEEGYAQTDDHLREMEKEAYTKGNMLFRDWTDSRSNPDGQKDIMARIMQEWGYDETALTEEGSGFEEGQLVKVVASALAIDGEKNGTVVSFEDPAVTIKLDDDQEGKYVPDDKMVKVKKDYVEPRAEAGFDDVMGEGVEGEVNPIDFANEHELDYQTDNEGNVVLYLTQEQGEALSLPDGTDDWQVEETSYGDDEEGGYVIYTNSPYVRMEETNVNEDFDDDDFDMESLEQEFPWLAKNVKAGEVPPEVAAELAHEFGDKEKPEEETEDVTVMKEMDTEMSCGMKGGKWHAEEGVCSFGDEHQRPDQLRESEGVPDWVHQLVQMAADDNPDAHATEEVGKEYNNYVVALEDALVKLVGDEMAEEMMSDDAPYAVLMTLMGHGVGIWDGRWDEYESDSLSKGIDLAALEAALKQALGSYADDTGGGSLNDAINNAAYETAGGEEMDEKAIKEAGTGNIEIGDDVDIMGSALAGAAGKVLELTTNTEGAEALVVQLTKAADRKLFGGVGDEVIVKPEFVELSALPGDKRPQPGEDQGVYAAHYTEAISDEEEKVIKEAEFVGHHAEVGGETYVDSNFLNSVRKIRDTFPSELKSMGFGEFYLETPKGRVDFNRSRGEDFPGAVGRSHQLSSEPPELADELIAAMEAEGASEKAAVEEKMSPEEEKEMTDKMSNKEFHDYATKGKFTRPSIDRERYTDLSAEGLEGPFQFDSGAILYYDPKTGQYYDRDKDMYLDREEAAELTMETLKEGGEPLVYKKTPWGWSHEADETIGEMLVALVDGGALEWHEVTDQESLKKMLTSHKEGVQGGMERWDADVFEDYYNVDVEFVIKEWAKMNGREAVKSEENEDEMYERLKAMTLDEDATNTAFLTAINEDDFDLFNGEPEEVSRDETVTLVHKTSGKEIVVTAIAAKKKLATGEWEEMSDTRGPAQPPLKEKQQETQDMNLEEMVRAAVRKALKEKKYRREDDEDEPQGDLSAAQKELDLDDDGKIEPSDLKGLRSGKTDDDVGKEKEKKEEKNESFAAMLAKQTDKINKKSRDSAETLKKLKTKDDGTYDYEQGEKEKKEGKVSELGDPAMRGTWEDEDDPWGDAGEEEEEKVDEFLGAKLQKNIKKVNKKGTDNVKATAGHVARMEKEEEKEEKKEAIVPEWREEPEPGHTGVDLDQIQSAEDPEYAGSMIHTLPGVKFTGNIERDVAKMNQDEELASWLWGEMESGDTITDASGEVQYAGADVQDFLNENESNKEWYDSKLFDSLKRKWAK